jgi:hypothetical protein
MKKIAFLLSVLISLNALGQDKQALKYAKTIKEDDLKKHLTIIASDEYEGRETGKKGQKMAAEYISNYFKEIGLQAPVDGSYYQKFSLTQSSLNTCYFMVGDEKRLVFEDFVYYSTSETSGEEYIDVIIADQRDSLIKSYKNKYVAYRVTKLNGLENRIYKAKEEGALGYIIIIESDDEFRSTLRRFGRFSRTSGLTLEKRVTESDKMIIINKEILAWIYSKSYENIEPGDRTQVIFNADYLDKPTETENVLGFIPGTEMPEQVIVITAHYDHLGITNGKINNGADDDGSGTVAVMELAEAFLEASKNNKGPKRSILFMTVSGEEK